MGDTIEIYIKNSEGACAVNICVTKQHGAMLAHAYLLLHEMYFFGE